MVDIDWGRNMYDWQGEKIENSQWCFPKMLRNVYNHELRGSMITSKVCLSISFQTARFSRCWLCLQIHLKFRWYIQLLSNCVQDVMTKMKDCLRRLASKEYTSTHVFQNLQVMHTPFIKKIQCIHQGGEYMFMKLHSKKLCFTQESKIEESQPSSYLPHF